MYKSEGGQVNKIVSASEFKAKCLRLIDEMQVDGQPITITKRGKVVAEMRPGPKIAERPESLFGSMKGSIVVRGDLDGPIDPDWEAKWNAKWDERGFPVQLDAK